MKNTYTFTAKSTERIFTARVVSIAEFRAMSQSKAAIAKQYGVPESHALTALHVSASLVDPALSVADALKLHKESPGYYAEIAGPITDRFTAVVNAWEKQVQSAVRKSKGHVRTAVKQGTASGKKKPGQGGTSRAPSAPAPGLPVMLPFRRK